MGAIGKDEDPHSVMHVTGYIKPWPPSGYSGVDGQPDTMEDMSTQNQNASSNYCLVGIARLQVRFIETA